MILGTPKIWWIAAGVLFVGGLLLTRADIGGMLGNVAGVVMVLAGILVFAAAPMRYGRAAGKPEAPTAQPVQPVQPPAPAPLPPRPRANIEAKDASEV
jgi:drug/metabolite transporter (DMT)-like permease